MGSPTVASTFPLTAADLVCVDDLDPLASETTSDLQNLEQDVLHIIQETLGSNPDDVTRGVGVDQLIGGSTIPLVALPGIIDQGLAKDDRIDSSRTTITDTTTGPIVTFELDIVIQVGAAVLGLAYSYSATGGLVVR